MFEAVFNLPVCTVYAQLACFPDCESFRTTSKPVSEQPWQPRYISEMVSELPPEVIVYSEVSERDALCVLLLTCCPNYFQLNKYDSGLECRRQPTKHQDAYARRPYLARHRHIWSRSYRFPERDVDRNTRRTQRAGAWKDRLRQVAGFPAAWTTVDDPSPLSLEIIDD